MYGSGETAQPQRAEHYTQSVRAGEGEDTHTHTTVWHSPTHGARLTTHTTLTHQSVNESSIIMTHSLQRGFNACNSQLVVTSRSRTTTHNSHNSAQLTIHACRISVSVSVSTSTLAPSPGLELGLITPTPRANVVEETPPLERVFWVAMIPFSRRR